MRKNESYLLPLSISQATACFSALSLEFHCAFQCARLKLGRRKLHTGRTAGATFFDAAVPGLVKVNASREPDVVPSRCAVLTRTSAIDGVSHEQHGYFRDSVAVPREVKLRQKDRPPLRYEHGVSTVETEKEKKTERIKHLRHPLTASRFSENHHNRVNETKKLQDVHC